MDKKDKIEVEVDREVLNQLIKMKEVGDSYSTVIKRLIENEVAK